MDRIVLRRFWMALWGGAARALRRGRGPCLTPREPGATFEGVSRWLLALRCGLRAGALASCAAASVALTSAACAPSRGVPAAAPDVTPATFAVRLVEAKRPGDRGMLSTTVRSWRTTVVTEDGRIVKREDHERAVDLEAIAEVIRVDGGGAPVSLAYTVEHLVVETPAGRTEVLPGGWVVSAERGGGRLTLHSAEPLPVEARAALDDILSPLPAEATDDEVFGAQEPQPIGVTWPVNAALAARELRRLDLDVPAESVRGQSRLVGLVEVGGQVYLDLAGELAIHDARLLSVPGAHPETAELRSTYHRRLPVDLPGSPRASGAAEVDATLRVDMDVTATIALGPGREGRLTATSRRETRRRYLPLD
jgi:hypothetical protein